MGEIEEIMQSVIAGARVAALAHRLVIHQGGDTRAGWGNRGRGR